MFLSLKNALKSRYPEAFIVIRKIFSTPYGWITKLRLRAFQYPILFDFKNNGIGFKIKLDPKNGTVDEQIFLHGAYEPNILNLYRQELNVGDTYVDIGANIGQHALFAAVCVGKNGKVRAFEPIPRLYKQILESIQLNDMTHFEVISKALGLTDEHKDIYITENNIGGSSLIKHGEYARSETIEVANANDQLSDLKRIDFIKIDTEGYELIVLQAMLSAIAAYRPKIIFEFNPELYTPEQFGVLLSIQNLGYEFIDYYLYERRPIASIVDWKLPKGRTQADIFCRPKVLQTIAQVEV